LPSRADVLELGSHLGGFLEVAESWNWNPIGLDVGWQTSQFARHKGFKVHRSTLEDSALASSSADAIFIWNCFEQIEDPKPTLRAANRLLKDTGLLRYPGAERRFLSALSPPHAEMERPPAGSHHPGTQQSSGIPVSVWVFRAAPPRSSLRRRLEASVQHNAALITIPFPEMTRKLKKETADVERWVAQSSLRKHGSLDGPWIEMVFRRRET
jgi:hypothetical protein